MTVLRELLSDETATRESAIRALEAAPEQLRLAMAARLTHLARESTAALATAQSQPHAQMLARACSALAVLRIDAAKQCLLRIAEEGSRTAKATLANALRATKTPDGRAVLVHLLSDDEVRGAAILAIGEEPWPGILASLIEIAETDERAAVLALGPIARCGEAGGPNESSAAADFLLEQLDDDAMAPKAAIALLRLGRRAPAVVRAVKHVAKNHGPRKIPCLFVVAGHEPDDAVFLELARAVGPKEHDAARRFLKPLRDDESESVRLASTRTWNALGLS